MAAGMRSALTKVILENNKKHRKKHLITMDMGEGLVNSLKVLWLYLAREFRSCLTGEF